MTVKSSLLEMLEKNKGEVLSGESIAGELGCTRAAVWKAVKSLREEGYHIEAGPNKGYMLAKDTNRLSQEGIRLFLDDPKVKIDIYDELYHRLGGQDFRKLFPVILTDNGSEFSNPKCIENGPDGKGFQRTRIYYCNPSAPYQKAEIEWGMSLYAGSYRKEEALMN